MSSVNKILFVGDGSVGKTSICRAYMGKELPKRMTLGIEIEYVKVGDKEILIWDLGGETRFREIIEKFIGNPNLIVLVFDLSRKETLFHLVDWVKLITKNIESGIKAILVGNKADLKREVMRSDVEEVLKKLDVNVIEYLETSAKTGYNIKNLFETIAKNV